jgi:Na+-transporting methylmalonyl-CoA/oxaloacetate decarboxylase gamma subunit
MSDVLAVFEVVFSGMTFVVLLLTLIVGIVKAIKSKKK